MTQENLNEILEKHKLWLDDKPGGECAHLEYAHLKCAHLKGARLEGASWDFSSGLPLHCGGSSFYTDSKFIRQLFAHISTLLVTDADDEMKAALEAIKSEARKSHRAKDLGLLEGKPCKS